MKQFIFSVFDDKAEVFMPPFYQSTQGMAVRVFADAARQEDHPFCQNPGDYHLYEIGVFNSENGIILGYDENKHLASADSVNLPAEPKLKEVK